MKYISYIYFLTKRRMPNRDWTWPQWKGPMTWTKMWACKGEGKQWKNLPFESGQWKVCWKWMRRWIGNRWNTIIEEWQENNKKEGN